MSILRLAPWDAALTTGAGRGIGGATACALVRSPTGGSSTPSGRPFRRMDAEVAALGRSTAARNVAVADDPQVAVRS